jgi:hypothetical protein
MSKSMMVVGSRFLLVAVLSVVASRADAQTVTVYFNGTGPNSSTFEGWFSYDQSVHGSGGHFSFTTQFHEIEYLGSSISEQLCSGTTCSYNITTSGKTFTLVSICPKSPATTVTIVLPTSVTLSQTSLPPYSDFITSPTSNTTQFTLSGGTTYSGQITSVSNTPSPVKSPAPPADTSLPPPASYAYTCAAPQACPVYACQPRPACCLTRLFARRCHRNSCW